MQRTKWGFVEETNRLLREAMHEIRNDPGAKLSISEVTRRAGFSRDILSDKRSAYTEIQKEIREAVSARVKAAKASLDAKSDERREVENYDKRKHALACEIIRSWNLSRGRTADGYDIGTKTVAERRISMQVVRKPSLKKI